MEFDPSSSSGSVCRYSDSLLLEEPVSVTSMSKLKSPLMPSAPTGTARLNGRFRTGVEAVPPAGWLVTTLSAMYRSTPAVAVIGMGASWTGAAVPVETVAVSLSPSAPAARTPRSNCLAVPRVTLPRLQVRVAPSAEMELAGVEVDWHSTGMVLMAPLVRTTFAISGSCTPAAPLSSFALTLTCMRAGAPLARLAGTGVAQLAVISLTIWACAGSAVVCAKLEARPAQATRARPRRDFVEAMWNLSDRW